MKERQYETMSVWIALLPASYGIGTGPILNIQKQVSYAVDIVVYDQPPAFEMLPYSDLPAQLQTSLTSEWEQKAKLVAGDNTVYNSGSNSLL